MLTERNRDGEQEYAGTSLNDRLLLTPVPSGSEEKIILPALTLLEKAVLYAEGESCPPPGLDRGKLADLTPVELLRAGSPTGTGDYRSTPAWQRFLLERVAGLGSAVTDRAPALKILCRRSMKNRPGGLGEQNPHRVC